MSYEGTEVTQTFFHAMFFSKIKLILSDSVACVIKATMHSNEKSIQHHDEQNSNVKQDKK